MDSIGSLISRVVGRLNWQRRTPIISARRIKDFKHGNDETLHCPLRFLTMEQYSKDDGIAVYVVSCTIKRSTSIMPISISSASQSTFSLHIPLQQIHSYVSSRPLFVPNTLARIRLQALIYPNYPNQAKHEHHNHSLPPRPSLPITTHAPPRRHPTNQAGWSIQRLLPRPNERRRHRSLRSRRHRPRHTGRHDIRRLHLQRRARRSLPSQYPRRQLGCYRQPWARRERQLLRLLREEYPRVSRTRWCWGRRGINGVGQQQNHPDGRYYADVYDVTTVNDIVGRCVYDESHPANCATTGSNLLETGIKVRCSPPYIWIRGRCSNTIIVLLVFARRGLASAILRIASKAIV